MKKAHKFEENQKFPRGKTRFTCNQIELNFERTEALSSIVETMAILIANTAMECEQVKCTWRHLVSYKQSSVNLQTNWLTICMCFVPAHLTGGKLRNGKKASIVSHSGNLQ